MSFPPVKPEITAKNRHVKAAEGEVVTIACAVQSYPLYRTYWRVPNQNETTKVDSTYWKYNVCALTLILKLLHLVYIISVLHVYKMQCLLVLFI